MPAQWILIACAILTTQLLVSQIAVADPSREFPGTGSYEKWKAAADSSDDGFDYARRNQFNNAIQCYDEAIQLYPYDASFYYNKATALNKMGRAKDSLPLFKKAIELEPTFTSAWYNLGNAQQSLNDLVAAEASFKSTVKLDPKHMHAWFNLGENLLTQKKLLDAKDAFAHASALPCTDQDKKDITNYQADIERLLRK